MDWDLDWEFGGGGIFRGLWRMLLSIASLFGGLLLLLLFVTVAVLLIRYLLVATKAAQLYVDAHTPAEERRAADPAASDTATPEPTDPDPARPTRAPRSRTPKTPPAT